MTVSSSASASSAPLVVNGLISGINTPQVIQALLEGYQQPITNLQNEQSSLTSQASDYQALNSDMQAVLNAAESLSTSSAWNLMTATSSASSVASATAAPGAQAGTLSFTVGNLAQGNLQLSGGSVSSTQAQVTSASSVLIATGAPAIGFSALADNGLGLGAHTITVTQSSQAASITGTAPAPSTTIDASNDTLDLTINNAAVNLTLAPGTNETPAGLVSAINTAAGNADAPITASLNAEGQIQIATNEQGSQANLTITGGSALSALGLSDNATSTGVDAVVTVDGTKTTLSSLIAGEQVTLDAPTGSINATVGAAPDAGGSLVGVGTASAALVSTGSGSLADLVANVNDSGIGATATMVQEASGAYRLQLSANSTGLAGAVTIDDSVLTGGALGTMNTITAAADATVNVGGASGYSLTSSTNTFTSLMPGTAITVASLGSATVTVAPDASGEASQVSTLVSAANQALSDIQALAGYNETTKTGGPLMGSALVQNVQNELSSIFASVAGTSGLGSSQNVGITLASDGSLSFNSTTFEQAYDANPTQVASLFTQDGTFSPTNPADAGAVSLVYAGNSTASGSYDVNITQSASAATDTGAALADGSVSEGETLSIGLGGTNVTYAVAAGQSLATIAAGLNATFGANGMGLSAQVDNSGTQLQITANNEGSGTSFTVESDTAGPGTTGLGGQSASTPQTFTGTDVAGTINGGAATGSGQILTAPSTDATLDGLSLMVTTSGITSPTDLGTFTYEPGLAQQLVTLANEASNAQTGSLTNAAQGLTSESTGLNTQIATYTSLMDTQQTVLQQQFATMESTLGTLKSESSQLSSEISGLTSL